MHLPSFIEHYGELAERVVSEGWSPMRYLTEQALVEASGRTDRGMTRLLTNDKLPRDKTRQRWT